VGGPPGGFIGYLPQTRVTYDYSELKASGIASSPTLLDNLNHIRYKLTHKHVDTVTQTSCVLNKSNDVVLCDCTSNNILVELPELTGIIGRTYRIKKIDSGGNTVTISGYGSEQIEGQITRSLSSQYSSLTIIAGNTEWYIF